MGGIERGPYGSGQESGCGWGGEEYGRALDGHGMGIYGDASCEGDGYGDDEASYGDTESDDGNDGWGYGVEVR